MPNHPDRSRRSFLTLVATAGSVTLVGLKPGLAPAQGRVSPNETLARSLGYTTNASTIDRAKYPSYKPGDACAHCRFYQGKPGAAWGPCQIFAGKLVNSRGWCISFSRKT